MILLTPFLDYNEFAQASDEEKAEVNMVDVNQVATAMTEIFADADTDTRNYTAGIRSAHGSDGNEYRNLSLKVCGSGEINGARYLFCEGGFAVNIDALIDTFSDLKKLVAA